MLKTRGPVFDGQRVVVSGSGNVAINAIEKAQRSAPPLWPAPTPPATSWTRRGIDVALLRQIKEVERGRLKRLRQRGVPPVAYVEGGSSGTSTRRRAAVRHAERARRRRRRAPGPQRLLAVAEGANMPRTADAVAVFQEPASCSARARPPTPAAWPPPRWRCSRTPAATPGPSRTPRPARRRSWSGSTTAARQPPTSTGPGQLRAAARTSPASCKVADAMLAPGLI